MIENIPYLILLMIIYDLSVHFVYAFKFDEKIIKKKLNWWPNLWGDKYQAFWITYWVIALVLVIIYIAFR
ncbi:hypothetical protein KBC25_03865 [Candidatus Pacearchaeota archaeon]|jgi:hypothetical protein|nr:hypothetical protein [Candidatus Pacearchaeota archaeon]